MNLSEVTGIPAFQTRVIFLFSEADGTADHCHATEAVPPSALILIKVHGAMLGRLKRESAPSETAGDLLGKLYPRTRQGPRSSTRQKRRRTWLQPSPAKYTFLTHGRGSASPPPTPGGPAPPSAPPNVSKPPGAFLKQSWSRVRDPWAARGAAGSSP